MKNKNKHYKHLRKNKKCRTTLEEKRQICNSLIQRMIPVKSESVTLMLAIYLKAPSQTLFTHDMYRFIYLFMTPINIHIGARSLVDQLEYIKIEVGVCRGTPRSRPTTYIHQRDADTTSTLKGTPTRQSRDTKNSFVEQYSRS